MTALKRLPKKPRPVFKYRERQLTDGEFEAVTDQVIHDVGQMEEFAKEDARALLAALPDMGKLDVFAHDGTERYAFAFMFMRAIETFQQKANPFSIIEVIEIVLSDTNAARAMVRHAPHRKAREFVRAEWERHRESYGNNKSAFARDYVRRVWNEMNLSVTEKQLREVWLSDTRSTGKQAGLRADG